MTAAARPATSGEGEQDTDDGADLDTPALGFALPRSADDGFAGNADDTVVLDADVAAGRTAAAPDGVAAPDAVAAPYPGAALPLPGGGAPKGHGIKALVDPMLYHAPNSPAYAQTVAEVWFRTEDDAEEAGFRPWNWRARRTGSIPRLDADGHPVTPAAVTPAAATTAEAPEAPAAEEPVAPEHTEAAAGPGPVQVPELEDLPELPTASSGTPGGAVTPVEESRYGPGSAAPLPDGSAPSAEYRIKGNGGSMLYHTMDSPYYGRTRAVAWFRTEEDAQRAGFEAWNRRARQTARAARAAMEEGRYEDGPYPGSARPTRSGAAPTAEFTVKASEDSKLYHTAESPLFGITRAEVWFRSEADALRAGFAAWRTKVRT
ncbi:MAG TPA: hypothetical protein VGD67_14415 [Pseudonocardiaceae bacterium]